MTVTITSREEAEALMSDCAICSKPKFALTTNFGAEATTYTLGRCGDKECIIHCHGHPGHVISVDLRDLGDLSN